MKTLLTDAAVADESRRETRIEAYFRLRREATMLEARAAALLAEIDADGLYEEAGYLSTSALMRDRGDSPREASRRVSEARELRRHHRLFEAFAAAAIDRPRVALLLRAARAVPECLPVVNWRRPSGRGVLEAGCRSRRSRCR